ncbi:MAG: hypothetical protein M0T84_07885 [Betaproteobacteria bacterium]|nr:hypothetical protein [Betaproteobacteria bacterium]
MLKQSSGFTRIELAIALLSMGMIAGIAYGSYKASLRQTHQRDVEAYMTDLAQQERQYYLDTRSYTRTYGFPGLNDAPPDTVSPYYRITIALRGARSGFTITATPIAGSAQAGADALSLTSSGRRMPGSDW